MEFIKVVPAILAGGLFSLPLLTIADTTISWPEKFDRIEVHINVKNNGTQSDTPIILKVSVDSSSEKSKIEYKKEGKFEKAEKAVGENKADQYKNLGKVARQFIKVQHKLNLIKSQRWHEGQENTKFEELCRTCSTQPPTPNNCSICMCCRDNCPTEPLSTSQSCKYQLNKNTLGKFFLDIKNLNSANTSKYLSPVRVVMTFTPENGDNKYEKGSFWGSLIYGYVDYRYKKTEKPESDPTLKDVVTEVPTDSPDDNYFANVPQKFTFKMDKSEDGDLDKILDKLNKNDMKDLMQEKNTNSGSLCGCCEDNSNKVECMINRNYSVSLKDDSAITQFEEKLKNINGDCCKKLTV